MKAIKNLICPALTFACFALSPALNAGCPNPPGVCFGQNTAVGENALFNATTGVWNVGVGVDALFSTEAGNQNTAVGYQTLFTNTSGDHCTGIGSQALFNNTFGSDNVGVGFRTLYTNTTGNRNTGMGYRTLALNDTGSDNTAVGWNALFNNRGGAGAENTAVGSNALFSTSGSPENVAVGFNALYATTVNGFSGYSVAVGSQALQRVTTGGDNTAVGWDALGFAVTGTDNTAVGWSAGVGYLSGESNNISIGAGVAGITGESNTIRIGDGLDSTSGASQCFIGGIWNQAGGSQAVYVNSAGKLGAQVSSRRFKDEIKPMERSSEVIYGLKPVSFRYKPDIDPTRPHCFGLIAEDVEKMNPDLVVRDKEGKPRSVRYDAINAMLLNEFLKEHRTVQEQGATIADLKKQIEALTAGLQKVSAQLEASKSTPQTVLNNQ